MFLSATQKARILLNNPQVRMVYDDPDPERNGFVVVADQGTTIQTLNLPKEIARNRCTLKFSERINTLPLNARRPDSRSTYQQCQDEPIRLGTQIQPQEAPWVGTAGCPVRWRDLQSQDHWGILSNWHVFSMGRYDVGHPQHQPLDNRPACAYLAAATPVDPSQPNTTDAAIADAMVNGFHSIDWQILDLGPLTPTPVDATVGQAVHKVGRTTGLTKAVCSAVGAGVRVNYGDFEAIFLDQDVFDDVDGSFSAPGDSGSLIVCDCNNGPTSLLFAGGGGSTIGNPIRFVIQKLNLHFDP